MCALPVVPPPQDHIRCYMKQLLYGLHHLHSLCPKVIHRDIKSAFPHPWVTNERAVGCF